ncbi:flavin-containing monooxygenase [Risungbinella massiliensis]|uniref:flavin-containing monooxygenase n=1 Tax=Risungbinella massiliensis TaxID=1329796 RepID=UPI0005CC0DF4|nr:NAD(P)/FAD-dependent oxidoreductase [Risungbinella massiliensis]
MNNSINPTVIVGSGQAGLEMAYALTQTKIPFLLLESEKRVGESWRNRYDSLVLFTPRKYSSLTGYLFPGDPEECPTKDEVADYLEAYVQYFDFPIHYQTKVLSIHQVGQNSFLLRTNQGEIQAANVILATGGFAYPNIPPFANTLSSKTVQLHSSQYRNPNSLQSGSVLVVGAGNSGAHIAAELGQDRHVYLSTSHPISFAPLRLFGKSIFWYFDKLGLVQSPLTSKRGKLVARQREKVYGSFAKNQIRAGKIQIVPRVTGAHHNQVLLQDGQNLLVDNIIWATGFTPDFSWIQIPDTVDSDGKPYHHLGVSPVAGIYYIGLPWQRSRGSSLMGWVKNDATYLASKIKHFQR